MNIPNPLNVGFLIDLDGLLINSEEIAHNVMRDVCAEYGGNFTYQLHSRILGTESEYWSEIIVKECGLSIDPVGLVKEFYNAFGPVMDQEVALMPGSAEFLEWAERLRLRKCLVTSSKADFAKRYLEKLNISKYFEAQVTAESTPESKPHPSPYLEGARILGLSPKDCIVLEDSVKGCLSGSDAGCYVIAVPTRFARDEDFSMADFVAEDLIEALDHIRNR